MAASRRRRAIPWEIPQQRYAYDFLIVDGDGRHFSGDEKESAAYYCYGREILAPADGFVVALYTDAPDSPINKRRPVCAADDLRGNFVLLNHGSGVYSLLCHLKPGSIYVHVGQAVARGERIARCGNSGNTTEPHLHFQLAGWPRFLRRAQPAHPLRPHRRSTEHRPTLPALHRTRDDSME